MHQALTDLHAYVLVLDAERQGVERQVAALDAPDGDRWIRSDLERQHAAIAEQLDLLRATLIALRSHADPGGTWL